MLNGWEEKQDGSDAQVSRQVSGTARNRAQVLVAHLPQAASSFHSVPAPGLILMKG